MHNDSNNNNNINIADNDNRRIKRPLSLFFSTGAHTKREEETKKDAILFCCYNYHLTPFSGVIPKFNRGNETTP
jgi:hypothetical protein